jgi:endonuclease/exonuclease/phosphatase family metal-dependent hydrolase
MRILTYNIWNGGKDRMPLIRDVIQARQPDVVALEEANDRDRAAELAGDLGMEIYHGEANSAWHIAWLSCLPITHSENRRLPVLSKTLVEIGVEWEGVALHLFATHLNSDRSEQAEELRAAEVRAILTEMGEFGGQRVLVGDFNTLAPHAVRPPLEGLSRDARERAEKIYAVPRLAIPLVLEAGYADSYQMRHPAEQGYTFKAWEPVARFDYIFASPDMARRLTVCDLVTGELTVKASDHLPLWAEFV